MKTSLKKVFFLLLICISPFKMYSQLNSKDIIMKIRNELDAVKNGSIATNDYTFNSQVEKKCLDFINTYKDISNMEVYLHALIIKSKIGISSKNLSIKQSIVNDFTVDIASLNIIISKFALSALANFDSIDFSILSKNRLINNFGKLKLNKEYLLICGVADITELKAEIKEIASKFNRKTFNWFTEISWFANLTLVRMGDTTNIDNMVSAVELELDPALRVTRLLKDVSYSKNSDIFKLLQKYLESNDSLESSRGGKNGVGFNQYALEYLANSIKDFPIQPKGLGYTKEDIQTAIIFLRNKYKQK